MSNFLVPLYSYKYYGMNFFEFKRNIKYGLTYGFLLGLIVFLIRYYFVSIGMDCFKYSGITYDSLILYPIIAIVQEIVVKGYAQTFLVTTFKGMKYSKFIATLISALLFAKYHIIFGVIVTLLTFFFGIVTGYIYEKTHSVVGVSIMHIIVDWVLLLGVKL